MRPHDAPSPTVPLASPTPPGFVAGNYFDKYRSRNPIHRILVGNFLRCAQDLLAVSRPNRILEVGCGAGDLARRLLPTPLGEHGATPAYLGIDLSAEQIARARARYPEFEFLQASVYALPFPDNNFDLVLACEVFEHLDDPTAALREVERVCRGFLLLSVPWEPWWRVLNVLRGKYLRAWGNTPGHVRHFTRSGIRQLVATRFRVVAERHPFPWTMLLARPN